MRDPTTDKAEQARVSAAVKEAYGLLLPLRRVSWGDPNNNHKLELEAAVGFVDTFLQNLQDQNLRDQALSQEDIRSWVGTLRKHVLPVLRRGGRPPKRQQRGQPPQTLRDRLISDTVNQICQKYGFSHTRNIATKDLTGEECGCSIVAEALKRLGIKLSEERVAAIWAKYGRV